MTDVSVKEKADKKYEYGATKNKSDEAAQVARYDEVADGDPSIISMVFLLWMLPTIWRGFRNRFDAKKMPKLWKSLSGEETQARAAMIWEKELASGNNSVWNIVCKFDRTTMYTSVVLVIFQGAILSVGRPLMLNIAQSTLQQEEDGKESDIPPAALVVLLTLLVICECVFATLGRHLFNEIWGMKLLNGLTYLIVKKCGRLGQGETCDAISLIGNDIIRASESLKWTCWLPSAITGIGGGIIMLLIIVGTSSLPGIAVCFAILILNMCSRKKKKQTFKSNMDSCRICTSSSGIVPPAHFEFQARGARACPLHAAARQKYMIPGSLPILVRGGLFKRCFQGF